MNKNFNIIDRKFYGLIDKIKESSYENLVYEIKKNYCTLSPNIKSILENYFKKYPFWGSLCENENDFTEIEAKAKVLNKHLNDFIWLYKKLGDYKSKYLLFAILNNWINYDFKSLKHTLSPMEFQYFDFNLIPNCKNQIFVDVGAYLGETTLNYINCYGKNSYKKIYCFEITPSIFNYMQNNLKLLSNITCVNKALQDKEKVVYMQENSSSLSANRTESFGKQKISCTTLDKFIKGKVDIIKMDIEGDEGKALKGCKEHIIKYSPKLLISIYHKNKHYFKLAKLIYSYNKNYNFYLRNYGGELYPTEIVLYALPKEIKDNKKD